MPHDHDLIPEDRLPKKAPAVLSPEEPAPIPAVSVMSMYCGTAWSPDSLVSLNSILGPPWLICTCHGPRRRECYSRCTIRGNERESAQDAQRQDNNTLRSTTGSVTTYQQDFWTAVKVAVTYESSDRERWRPGCRRDLFQTNVKVRRRLTIA